MKKQLQVLILTILFSASLFAYSTSDVNAGKDTTADHSYLNKVDRDLLKKVSNSEAGMFSTIIIVEGSLQRVEDLILSKGGSIRLRLDSINAVSADIPSEQIVAIAESRLVQKVWMNHQIELDVRYETLNAKVDLLTRLLESSTKTEPEMEATVGDPKLGPKQFDPSMYAFPEGGLLKVEGEIQFQSIAFDTVTPDTYFTYQVGAEQLWAEGYFGQDTYVAVLDVGINSMHPMVSSAIVGGHSEVPFEPNWDDNWATHGTMTASMVAGRPVVAIVSETSSFGAAFIRWFPDKVLWPSDYPWIPLGYIGIAFIGEAPMANIWVEKVLAFAGYGELDWILAGMQHTVWLRENTDIHIDAISMSIGLDQPWSAINDGTDPWSLMVDWVVQHGITFVQSAGNSGPGAFTVGQGAASTQNIAAGGYVYARMMKFYYDASYGVGTADANLHMDDDDEMVFYFASRGPTRDYRYQPTAVAPCAFTIGAGPYSDMYWGSGTSFAAPRLAGEALLLINYYKDITGTYPTPERVKAAIAVGADFIPGYEMIDQGAGKWNPAKAATVLFSDDLLGTAKDLLNGNDFHSQYMHTTVAFDEYGVAEAAVTEPLGIEHFARFYVKLEDPDMYRFTITSIGETVPGGSTLYIWVIDPKSDLLNIAYAYYDTWYGKIYHYSDMGCYYWYVGSTADAGVYRYNQYWTPLNPGIYEFVVENDYFSLEAVTFTLRIEKSSVSMSASGDSVTLKNRGVDLYLNDRGGLSAYTGHSDTTSGRIRQDEIVVSSFAVPDDTTELIVTLDWQDDYSCQFPTDLDLYLIDPYGVMWVGYDPPFTPYGIFGGTVNIPETDYFGDFTAANIIPGVWTAIIVGYHVYPVTSAETFTLTVEVRIQDVSKQTIIYDAMGVDFFWEPLELPTIIVDGDDSYGTYTLPFEFPCYDGHTYDTIYVGTNGYITFDQGFSQYYGLWDLFLEHPMIAAQAQDLVSTVYALDHGSYVTILWYGRAFGDPLGPRDLMLAQLHNNGDIVLSCADWIDGGLAGASKGDGATYITISPADETAFEFTYSATTYTIDIYSYIVSDVAYEWEAAGTELFTGDDTYASYMLPFSFPFYGSSYDTIYVGSNGYITFDAGFSQYYDLWNLFLDHPMVAAMARDLVTTAYVTDHGSYVTILWFGRPYGDPTYRDLMLVRLYDTGDIFISYSDWVDGVAGVSKGDGSTYAEIAPTDNAAFLLTYGLVTVEITDVSYTIDNIPYFFEAVTPAVVSGDDAYGDYTLPFNFWFYGHTYNTIYVGTNGYITFTQGYTQYSNLENLFMSTPMIAAQAQDLVSSVYAIPHGDYVSLIWFGRAFGEYPPTPRELMLVQIHSNGDIYLSYKDWMGTAVAGISGGDGSSYVRVDPDDMTSFKLWYVTTIPPAVDFDDKHPYLAAGVDLKVYYTKNIKGRYIFVARHDWVEKFLRDGGTYASVFGSFLYENAAASH